MGARPQHTFAYRRLCALLREWREEADLTQRDLAARLKKVPSYVHKVEVGDRRIDPLEFIAWCRGCGIDPPAALSLVELEAKHDDNAPTAI
jgi:transcriptional regulator with XRE-family HTH domain